MDIFSIATLIISAVGVIIALVAIWIQTRQNNLALGATILRDLEKQFHWSKEMKSDRLALATFLLNRKPDDAPSTEASNLLDFFDILALYHNRGVIDTEMVWVTFYHWIAYYWQFLKKDADYYEDQFSGVSYYKNLRMLYTRLTEFGRKKRNLPRDEEYFSADNLRAFLVEEIRQCSLGVTDHTVQIAKSSMKTEEGKINIDGHQVWYRRVGNGGIPLLTLHGGPGAGYDYLEPLEGLATARSVILYDQLGCGNSDQPDDQSLWRIERFVAEVDAVRQALGLEQIHLLGHSWGGWLAIEYMLSRPKGVVSLILASTSASVPQFVAETTHLKKELPHEIFQTLQQYEASGDYHHPDYEAAVFEFYQRHLCRLDPWPEPLLRTEDNLKGNAVYETMNGPNEFIVIGNLKNWDRTDRLGEISVPTLITVGRYDELTPACAETLNRGILNSRMVIFEESAHLAHLEEPEKYRQVVADFLVNSEMLR